jgi:hypothetical protein
LPIQGLNKIMIKFMDTDEEPLFADCCCGSEMFEIRRSMENFDLSIWNRGMSSRPLCWKERLRWCWRILRTGDPWADSIIVSDENAMKISNYINKYINKNEK